MNASVVDFVGYGGTAATANHCYEGSGPASFTLSNNAIADFRKSGGCIDTNDNASNLALDEDQVLREDQLMLEGKPVNPEEYTKALASLRQLCPRPQSCVNRRYVERPGPGGC